MRLLTRNGQDWSGRFRADAPMSMASGHGLIGTIAAAWPEPPPAHHRTIVGLSPVDAGAHHDLLEILEERYGRRSTSSTSQFPVDKCHTFIGHLRRRHP